MKQIKIQNLYLEVITEILSSSMLDEVKSISRRRFIRSIKEYVEDIKLSKKSIAEKYAKKDDKGEYIIVQNNYQFLPEILKIFTKKIGEVNNEYTTLDLTLSSEKDLSVVQEIIKDEATKFIDANKNEFNAEGYDYVATLQEMYTMLNPLGEQPESNEVAE